MAFGLFNFNYAMPTIPMFPIRTSSWDTCYSNMSSIFSTPMNPFIAMPTLPIQPMVMPPQSFAFPSFSFNNILPSVTNLWNSFTSTIGKGYNTIKQGISTVSTKIENGYNTIKQGVSSVVSKVTNFFRGEARYQAQYTAISEKVKTYGSNAKFIEKLHPAMQEKVMQLLDWAKSKGISLTITSGFRSAAQQRGLQYKNKGGKKVAAAPGSSPHEYGIAIDFKSSNNAAVGQKAKELGMRWGGDWGGKGWSRETWHIDMANTIKKVRA